MSHQPERKEKNCLNCGTTVAGRYCQHCGQENVVIKQSAGSLIRHFLYDIFHFDGKFFDTVKWLALRPGFVPREYVAGKRMSYLDPVRMYLFTSAIFFLVFFYVKKFDAEGNTRAMTPAERLEYASQLQATSHDSDHQRQMSYLLDTSYWMQLEKPGKTKISDTSFLIDLEGESYMMLAMKRRPVRIKAESDWLEKKLQRSSLAADGESFQRKLPDFTESFLHRIPYLLFISLPFFALILKLLYSRKKQFYYSDHAIFTLYHYIFTFLLLLVSLGIGALSDSLGWSFLAVLRGIILLCGGVYLFFAMKKFYGQGWGKTFLKFILLNIMGFVMLLFLFLIFIAFTIIPILGNE